MIGTMKRTRAGFTLVELIVVIAILGILAGISVPVYSGYIRRAGEAGDLQLLGALNTAYAAACAEMNVDPTGVIGTAQLSGETGSRIISGISASGLDAAANEKLNAAFMRYYGENAAKPFKVYTSLGYDQENGVFINAPAWKKTINENGTYTFTNGQISITVNPEDIAAFNSSSFAQLEGGLDELMSEVDKVTLLAAANNKDGAYLVEINPETGEYAHNSGVSREIHDYLKDTMHFSDEEISEMSANEVANALVLMSASTLKDFDVDTALSQMLESGTVSLSNDMIDNAGGVPAGALTYAIAMGFVNSEYATEDQKAVFQNATYSNIGDVTSMFYALAYPEDYDPTNPQYDEDTGEEIMPTFNNQFSNYMSNNFSTDMNGFVSTMRMVDENIYNMDANELLQNGYTDPELLGMLKTILGD